MSELQRDEPHVGQGESPGQARASDLSPLERQEQPGAKIIDPRCEQLPGTPVASFEALAVSEVSDPFALPTRRPFSKGIQ